MTTTSSIVDTVREIVDMDEVDLPLSLIQTYLRDGFDRMINLERRWSFYETSTTLSTIADTREYAFSSIGSGNFREITSMVDSTAGGFRLTLIDYDDAEKIWLNTTDTASRPLYFAHWAGSIHLFPKPDMVYTLNVRGYRKPTYAWVTDTTGVLEPDCDDRLHHALIYYAVSQAYKRQEDTELSAVYKQSFDEAVALARRELMRPESHRPMVMSSGRPGPSFNYWLQSLGKQIGT